MKSLGNIQLVVLTFLAAHSLGRQILAKSGHAHYAISKQLPCPDFGGEGCVQGAKETGFIFSALHDPTLSEVSVFADFNQDLTKGDQAHNVTCNFWLDDPVGDPIYSSHASYDWVEDDNSFKHTYHPYIVRCPDPLKHLRQMPQFVGLALDGHDVKARTPIEQVGLTFKASVGACVAPIYTEIFDLLYEWLNHYTVLGVEGFHLYWTASKVRWDNKLPEEWTTEFRPFAYPTAYWYQYEHFTEEERYYYAQQTAYNDCVYRHKHEYDFMLMLDLDEFLIIRDERFQKGHKRLASLLHNVFPPLHAAMGTYRWAYRSDCRSDEEKSKQLPLLQQYTHREIETESPRMTQNRHFGDKLIVRPSLVRIFYMHWLQQAIPRAVRDTMNLQPAVAYVKHLRNHGHDCKELVNDDPFDQP